MIILNITDIDTIARDIMGARRIDPSWRMPAIKQAVADYFDDPDQQPDTATKARIVNRIVLEVFPD